VWLIIMENKKRFGEINQNTFSPPILGEFSNWAGVINSETQTIIDFGFVQPGPENQPKNAVIIRRMILPPIVAKELARVLNETLNTINEESKKQKTSK